MFDTSSCSQIKAATGQPQIPITVLEHTGTWPITPSLAWNSYQAGCCECSSTLPDSDQIPRALQGQDVLTGLPKGNFGRHGANVLYVHRS